jgi:site-specific recombinase XerD
LYQRTGFGSGHDATLQTLHRWLDEQDKTPRQVTLEDISAYINGLSQRRLSRTSLSIHVAKLRNFFRYAESKGWCGTGLAAIDAPRIYSLESLPRGPQWSDVQRLLTSCAGDRPTEIRDHAMLLSIAVYGLRSGKVRHLCLEDIGWEREIIHIRRSKQRKSHHYPLVHEVGTAILRYLREVRPRSKRREIFLSVVQRIEHSVLVGLARWCTSVCVGWVYGPYPTDPIRLDLLNSATGDMKSESKSKRLRFHLVR